MSIEYTIYLKKKRILSVERIMPGTGAVGEPVGCYSNAMRVLCTFLSFSALATAQMAPVSSLTLGNGMKVLVEEDHRIPSVAMYLFFRVGSRNERPGITGISHFFEHMMFNGAKKYGPKQFDIQMEKNGGENNAYTSADVTVYTDWFPKSALDLMFDMESDRMRDLSFDPKIIASEREVVYSERRSSVDNSNFGALAEQLQAAAFVAHPYHWPVVGWPSDIEAWTMDDLKAHFAMGYAPNNCTLVMVGDVTAAEVTALAGKYMERIPRHAPPPPVRTIEPEQKGERRVTLDKRAQLPLTMMAFHVPEFRSAATPALTMAEALLTEGESSRLYRRLVHDDELAVSVQSFREASLDPGLLIFVVQPRSGVETTRVEQAITEELAKLAEAGVSEADLRKAKNQRLVSFYRDMATIGGRANLIGEYEVFDGDFSKAFRVDKDIEAVTAAEVRSAAKKYLGVENRTVATLVPRKDAGEGNGVADE